MNVASRLSSLRQAADTYGPYITTAFAVYQVGSWLYDLYTNSYTEQGQQDGIVRLVDEPIELVVRPRRRHIDRNATADDQPSQDIQPQPVIDNECELLEHQEVNQSDDENSQSIIDAESDDPHIIYELHSNASTSLESTDTSRGVVEDLHNECFICAQDLDSGNKEVTTLPFCMHPFHKQCLEGVLKWHKKCPVCDCHIFSPV